MATIIKKADLRGQSATNVQPVAFSFADMSGRAEGFLESIREQAAGIIADAHKQAEVIRREAQQAGRRAAEDAVEKVLDEKVARQMQTLLPAINKLIVEIEDARNQWQTHWERSAVRLATAIAERIIRREIRAQPDISLQFVREALELAADASQVAVHLHPADYESLGKQAEKLAEAICRLVPTKVVADPEVSPGGCRIVTRHGEIDQRIEAQLSRIEEELS